jgi:hypothetical protein
MAIIDKIDKVAKCIIDKIDKVAKCIILKNAIVIIIDIITTNIFVFKI